MVGTLGSTSTPQDQDILKMKVASSTETLVPSYQITQGHNKQESNMNPHCHEGLRCYSLTSLSTLNQLLFLKREGPPGQEIYLHLANKNVSYCVHVGLPLQHIY